MTPPNYTYDSSKHSDEFVPTTLEDGTTPGYEDAYQLQAFLSNFNCDFVSHPLHVNQGEMPTYHGGLWNFSAQLGVNYSGTPMPMNPHCLKPDVDETRIANAQCSHSFDLYPTCTNYDNVQGQLMGYLCSTTQNLEDSCSGYSSVPLLPSFVTDSYLTQNESHDPEGPHPTQSPVLPVVLSEFWASNESINTAPANFRRTDSWVYPVAASLAPGSCFTQPASGSLNGSNRCLWKDCGQKLHPTKENLRRHFKEHHYLPPQADRICLWKGCLASETNEVKKHTWRHLCAHAGIHIRFCNKCGKSLNRSDNAIRHEKNCLQRG